jgi:D-Tyr-tRNAtyr deacylase
MKSSAKSIREFVLLSRALPDEDSEKDAVYLLRKTLNLRIFEDATAR